MLDAEFEQLSQSIGFPPDQLKYITCMLLCYPAALIFKGLPKDAATIKHIFSIVISLSFCAFCLGPYAWLHSFFSSLVTYYICMLVPHGTAHKVAFAWALVYMSVSHLYRIYVDYMGWTLDFTTMQMVLTIKLISFAYNYYDGNCPIETRSEEQKKRMIKKLPSLLEYYGFVYFFSSFLAGPAIEITEYQRYVDHSMFNDKYCNGKIPSTTGPGLKKFFTGLFFLPLVVLAAMYPVKILATDEYLYQWSWPVKLVLVYALPSLSRMKYYFGWSLSEGVCNLCGIGYNGTDKQGNPKWDRCSNVDPIKCEFAENMRQITTYWNTKTGDWLKNYVYLRLTPEGQRPPLTTTVATYTISAFWHGFYPGYYLFFLQAAVLTELGKEIRRVIRPNFVTEKDEPKVPAKYFYDFVSVLITMWFLDYAGVAFLLLSLENSIKFYPVWYFAGHLIPWTVYAILINVKSKRVVKKKEN